MLQKMREQARGVVGWVIISAIVVVLAVFGFGALNFFVASEPAVAVVGDVEIGQSLYERRVEQQRQQQLAQFGPDADPSLLDEDALRGRVLDGMIERALLLEGARLGGMGAPEAMLNQMIVDTPQFQVAGRFDDAQFVLAVRQIGLTPALYRDLLGEDLMTSQLATGVSTTSFVTDHAVREIATLSRQERDLAWLEFSPADYVETLEVSDDAVRDYYESNRDDFYAPERVSVDYLRVALTDIAAEETLEEGAVEAAYAEEVAAFEGEERRRSSHILLTTNDERDEAAAIALATELRDRVLAGEDFAALAAEYSDDPGSAPQGGDLGYNTRGTFVPPFEAALFELETGGLSEPVVSQFGVHLIRLDDIARTEPPSLARLRPTIEQRIRNAQAREKFGDLRARLETLAYEAPDLSEPAEALGLTIEQAEPFTRAGGEGDFALPAVVDAAFSEDVLEGDYNSAVLEPAEDVLLVLRKREYEPERLRDFEEVAEQARASLVDDRAREQALADAEAALVLLREGASVTGVAARFERTWSRLQAATRDAVSMPPGVREVAFSLPRPEEGARSLALGELAAGSRAVVAVTAVRDGDPAALTEAEREQLARLLRSREGGADFDAFRGALRRDIGIERRLGAES